jgi:hypothetical protein
VLDQRGNVVSHELYARVTLKVHCDVLLAAIGIAIPQALEYEFDRSFRSNLL